MMKQSNYRIRRVIPYKLAAWAAAAMILVIPVRLVGQSQGDSHPQTMRVTLEEALEMARENNTRLQMAGEDINSARAEYRGTNALFLPQISVEETAISTDNPLNVFGSKLKQGVVTASDFDPSLLNDPESFDNYTTGINVRQPLLNPSGWMGRAALKKRLEATRFQKERTKQHLEFQVKQTWYRMILAGHRSDIIDTTLTAAEANLAQAHNFMEQGMINRADLLAAEVRVRQLQNSRTEANNMLDNVRRQLSYLLGMDEDAAIVPDGSLQMREVRIPAVDMRGLNAHRSDMRAMENRIEAAEKNLASSKFNFVPSVNLFGSYEWNDDTVFGTDAGNYLVGATLQWDLFKGYENIATIRQSRAQLSKAKLQYRDQAQKNRVEVGSALRSLETARERVEIADATVTQAEESYRIRRNRYRQGMERMTDLLAAEASLAESKLQLATARFDYHLQAAKLEFLLEQDLTAD